MTEVIFFKYWDHLKQLAFTQPVAKAQVNATKNISNELYGYLKGNVRAVSVWSFHWFTSSSKGTRNTCPAYGE